MLVLGLTIFCGLAYAVWPGSGDPPPPAPSQTIDPLDAALREPVPELFPDGLPVSLEVVPSGLANLSAQSCNACHWSAHDQWADTPHASAWHASSYQAALQRAGNTTACSQCHLPLTNQHAQIATSYIDEDLSRPVFVDNPAWDPTLMAEGVGCAACHVRGNTILGVREAPGAPHPVTPSAELTSSTMCATCHQLSWPGGDRPFYDTYGEWERSAYAKAGVSCQDCHMPPVAAPVAASKFAGQASHSFTADTARAVSALVSLSGHHIQRGEPMTIDLRLQNTGSGHHFPTGSPFKAYQIIGDVLDAEGTRLAEPFFYELARSVEEIPPYLTLSDTRLPAGGEVALSWTATVPQDATAQDGVIRISVQSTQASGPPVVLQDIPIKIF